MEFTDADEAGTWAGFVAELGLNLVKVDGQVAIAADVAAGEVGDGLLVCGAENHRALAAVLQMEQGGAECLLASALLPEFDGLDDGHEDFLRARGVHLLSDDVLNLAHGAESHGEIGVNASGDLRDESGANEEPMARGVRVRRVIPQGFAEHPGHAHGSMVARGRRREKGR